MIRIPLLPLLKTQRCHMKNNRSKMPTITRIQFTSPCHIFNFPHRHQFYPLLTQSLYSTFIISISGSISAIHVVNALSYAFPSLSASTNRFNHSKFNNIYHLFPPVIYKIQEILHHLMLSKSSQV